MSRPIKSKKPSRALEPVGSVSKAFDVLRAFVDGQNQWGVRELAPVIAPLEAAFLALTENRFDDEEASR